MALTPAIYMPWLALAVIPTIYTPWLVLAVIPTIGSDIYYIHAMVATGSDTYYIHANVFVPSMFMEQEPQIPSRHDLLKVRVGSISFLILMRASRTIGPQLERETPCIVTY